MILGLREAHEAPQFNTLIGAAAWPLSAPAQQPAAMPVIGYFSSQSAIWDVARLTAWRKALSLTVPLTLQAAANEVIE